MTMETSVQSSLGHLRWSETMMTTRQQ